MIVALLVSLIQPLSGVQAQAVPKLATGIASTPSASGGLILRLEAGTRAEDPALAWGLAQAGVTGVLEELDRETGLYRAALESGVQASRAARAAGRLDGVVYAEPDYTAQAILVPNDTYYAQQWGMDKVQAPAAWDSETGSDQVVIALINSGIDLDHPDLAGKAWTNLGEIPGNGVDEDGNGLVDDVNGWNFVGDDANLGDSNGHGTQVAGVLAATGNNSMGVAGLCWSCKLMVLKVMSAGGVSNYSDIVLAVNYAREKGAQVINLSLGGYSDSRSLKDAISAAISDGIVIVAGAGNDNSSTPFYPAAYPGVLSVAGTNVSDGRWGGSNYGSWVSLSSPADNIQTTYLGSDYGPGTGTSLSAPFVAGAAALVRSHWPGWSGAMVRNQLLRTADDIDAANPGYEGLLGLGRVNAAAALQNPHPEIVVEGTTINGDPLGRPTPGESTALGVRLRNDWWDAAGVSAVLSTSDPQVTVTSASADYGSLVSGGAASGSFSFTTDAGIPYNHIIVFHLEVSTDGGAYTQGLDFTIQVRSGDEHFSGTVFADMTWTNDKTYLIDGLTSIAPGFTLTIQPGTLVKFTGNYEFRVGGTLVADGTESQPIRILAADGVTWNHLLFENDSTDAIVTADGVYQSGNILRWVTVEGASAGVGCSNVSVYLEALTVKSGGISCTFDVPPLWVKASQVTGNTTFSNQVKMSGTTVQGALAVGANSTIMNTTVSGTLNTGNGSDVQSSETGGLLTLNGAGMLLGNTARGGIVAGGSALVQQNTVRGSVSVGANATVQENEVFRGGISGSSPLTVTGNTVTEAPGWGVAVSGTSGATTIEGNRVVGSAGGIQAATGLIQGNLVANNTGVGIEIGSATVRYNSLVGNAGSAIKVTSGVPVTIEYNNFEFNTGSYDVENRVPKTSLPTVLAQNNWWGTTDNAVVGTRIYDDLDGEYTLGRVIFAPKLNAPDQTAPAYVRSVTMDPPDTVGIETGTFMVGFSRPMDTADNPQVSFQTVSNDAWTTKASMPTPRGHLGVAAASNGKIYAIGGDNSNSLATVEVYDPATDTWTTRASMPTPRTGPGVVAANNGKIYAMGGRLGTDLAIVEEYDPATDTWITRTSMPAPRSWPGVVAANNGKIYAIGGSNGPFKVATVEEYDPATDTWTTKASMPTPRSWHGVVAANNGKIYAIGGTNDPVLSTVEEYDPVADTWLTRASMPTPRYGLGVVAASNGKIYSIGGMNFTDPYLALVEEYDPATDTWTTRTSMPTPRIMLGVAAASNGKIYAIGGWNGTYLAPVEEYTLPDWGREDILNNPQWIDATTFHASYDFTTLNPRGQYFPTVQAAAGADGILIAPFTGAAFMVDYAGYISDLTPPLAPTVSACGGLAAGDVSASWRGTDPNSVIDFYRYAVGASAGGTQVVSWLITPDTSMSRSGLGLTAGQTYYVNVQARNEGGLWSDVSSGAFVAGANSCSLSGSAVTGETPLAGVIISVSGGGTAVTNDQGIFSFLSLAQGSYTLTPSLAGYSFAPSSLDISVPYSGEAIVFVGTLTTPLYSISGSVRTGGGTSIAGVIVSNGAGASALTGADGSYVLNGVLPGTYTITALKNGYSFSPASQSVTVTNAARTGIDFTGTPLTGTLSISGSVKDDSGIGIAGVVVSNGTGVSALTGADGSYLLSGLVTGNYTITPSLAGYMFTPPSHSVTLTSVNLNSVDFVGSAVRKVFLPLVVR